MAFNGSQGLLKQARSQEQAAKFSAALEEGTRRFARVCVRVCGTP